MNKECRKAKNGKMVDQVRPVIPRMGCDELAELEILVARQRGKLDEDAAQKVKQGDRIMLNDPTWAGMQGVVEKVNKRTVEVRTDLGPLALVSAAMCRKVRADDGTKETVGDVDQAGSNVLREVLKKLNNRR